MQKNDIYEIEITGMTDEGDESAESMDLQYLFHTLLSVKPSVLY